MVVAAVSRLPARRGARTPHRTRAVCLSRRPPHLARHGLPAHPKEIDPMKTRARTNLLILIPTLTAATIACDRPAQPTATASSASSAPPVETAAPAPTPL